MKDSTSQYVWRKVVDSIIGYFNDNNHVSVAHSEVSDAFNIGGPLIMEPKKRRSEVGKRQDVCIDYDFVSWFRQSVQWDPDADLYGHPMCEIPEGTDKA